jgi:hypothetical protein
MLFSDFQLDYCLLTVRLQLMTKQHLSILLILMMVITPVASAFNHCLSVSMHEDIIDSHQMTVPVLVDKVTTSKHKDMIKKQDKAGGLCHTSNNCAFHVCGGFGINSSISSFNAIVANYSFFTPHYSPLYSTALSTEIKPPILTL